METKNTSLYEQAKQYNKQGFSVIPIGHGTKQPVGGEKIESYQTVKASEDQLVSWFYKSNRQLAIYCGCVSNNLVVFDFDGEEWHTLFSDFIGRYPEIAETRTVITGSDKVHLWIKVKDLKSSITKVVRDFDKGHIELRANEHYVVVPPSIHPSGKAYAFENENQPIIEISSERLDQIINWLREGKKAIPSNKLNEIPSVPPVNDLLPQQKRLLARSYVNRTVQECIEGAFRNDKGYQLARELRNLALTIDEARVYMERFQKNVPQYPDKDDYEYDDAMASLESAYKNEVGTPYVPKWLMGENLSEDNQTELLNFPLTDAGNKESFLFLYNGVYRFIKEKRSWFRWDGQHWIEKVGVKEDFIKVMRLKNQLAISIEELKRREAIQKWTTSSERNYAMEAALDIAWEAEGIITSLNSFDADDWLLCCANGVVDLKTGQFRQATKEDMLHKSTNVYYDAQAKCPRWLQFLDEIFQGDKELISYIKKMVGYSLTGITSEQSFFICYGTGQNGKSVFLSVLEYLTGDYGQDTPSQTFKEFDSRANASPEIARMAGIRFVKSVEMKDQVRLNTERIKSLTGGDKITARFLFQAFFDFWPKFKLWLAVNHEPKINDTTIAMWRRVKKLPFNACFTGSKCDQGLLDKLKGEISGILNWAIEGCLEWQSEKPLKVPEAVQKATNEYRKSQNLIERFLEDETIRDETEEVVSTLLYRRYEWWCKNEGEEPIDSGHFGKEVVALGYGRTRDKANRYYTGLKLKAKNEN